jgi:hypothetical protein
MRKGWRVVASWRRRGCGKESGDCRCARAFSNSVLPCSAPTPVTVSPVVTCAVEAWGARASVSRPPKPEAQGSTEKRLAGAPRAQTHRHCGLADLGGGLLGLGGSLLGGVVRRLRVGARAREHLFFACANERATRAERRAERLREATRGG